MPSSKKAKQPEPKPDFTVSGNEVMDAQEISETMANVAGVEPLQEAPPEQPPQPQPQMITADALQSHDDLLKKARQDRAQQEANRRLNIIHEFEMQVKSQQSREPDKPLKDGTGRTWETYHDIFWKAKRGLLYPDDPMALNRYLAEVLGQEKDISWQDES